MTLKKAKLQLKRILQNHNHMPVLLWGQPGVGKSMAVKQVAEELGMRFIDIRLPLLMPSDLLGLPYPDKEHRRAKWLEPSFFPEQDSKEKILILFDEIGNAPMTVQNGCYRIILDRSIGDHYTFPKGVKIVAASNRETDKSGVGKFNSALANRFIHFNIDADLDAWKFWALKNGINEMVIGFLNFSQTLLCKEPKVEDKAYPTPRSWHKVSDLLNSGISDEDVIAGTIGKGAASEFFNYIEVYKDLPDIKKILAGEKIKMPKSPSVLYALSSSLVVRANEKNIDNVFKFSEGMPQEFHILTIRDIVRKDNDAKTFKACSRYQQWLNKYSRFYDDDSEETTEE